MLPSPTTLGSVQMNIRNGLVLRSELKEKRRVGWVSCHVVAVLELLVEQVAALASVLTEVASDNPVLLLGEVLRSLYLLFGT